MSADTERYTPIACGLYSEYEVLILRRQPLRIRWRDEGGAECEERLLPCDLQTRHDGEYLMARTNAGGTRELRLDRILHTEPESA